MKDDDQTILLEGLAEDVSAIQKMVNHLVMKSEKAQDSTAMVDDIKILKTGLDTLMGEIKNMNSSVPEIVEQQRVIDLKQQLDRISLRLSQEERLIRYYFSSPKIMLATITIVIWSLMLGAVADRIYNNYQQTHPENYGERSF